MPQLSVAVGATKALIGEAGLQPRSGMVVEPVTVGGVLSTFLIVAGDSLHGAIIPGVPATVAPQSAAVTYRVLIL